MIRGNLALEERILVELTNNGEIKFNIGNIYVAATPIFHQLPFFEQQTFAQCRHPDFNFKFQLKFSISPITDLHKRTKNLKIYFFKNF